MNHTIFNTLGEDSSTMTRESLVTYLATYIEDFEALLLENDKLRAKLQNVKDTLGTVTDMCDPRQKSDLCVNSSDWVSFLSKVAIKNAEYKRIMKMPPFDRDRAIKAALKS
jgi:hypothetical protein